MILCDLCGKDYTDSEAKGGLLIGSKAVCSECEKEFRKKIERNGEQSYIRGECPEGMSFREWVLSLR